MDLSSLKRNNSEEVLGQNESVDENDPRNWYKIEKKVNKHYITYIRHFIKYQDEVVQKVVIKKPVDTSSCRLKRMHTDKDMTGRYLNSFFKMKDKNYIFMSMSNIKIRQKARVSEVTKGERPHSRNVLTCGLNGIDLVGSEMFNKLKRKVVISRLMLGKIRGPDLIKTNPFGLEEMIKHNSVS